MSVFLPRLLARTAERHPDAAAFRCGDEELSYATLVERSHQLGNALAADGVRPGDLVGILMGKAIENAIAVYGIMAAGAAYVPLDPAAPVDRLQQISASCGLRHFVVDGPRIGRMTKLSRALAQRSFVYGVDGGDGGVGAVESGNGSSGPASIETTGWDEIATLSPAAPVADRPDDTPAYLIFTSGSTGTPKGIVHTHGSGSAYATMAADLYGLTADDRLSNFPPLHFDQSTFDFFSGPLVGATTVIIDKEHQLVPASLSQLIERERLTIWYSVPLALVQLLEFGALEERDCSSLRWVIYGGEPFPLKHLKALMERWPHARFSNCYGPAETNQCTYHHLEPLTDESVAADAGVPIGVTCPGMETVVVDPDDQPVGHGESGELVVHSPTMMSGYWAREDLNDRAFLELAGPTGTRRHYRTGDIVRVDDDGLLHFMGRRDRQIKVRGVRVELDEVEAVLSTHEAVQEVAVTIVPGEDNGRAIVAYVTVSPDIASEYDAKGDRTAEGEYAAERDRSAAGEGGGGRPMAVDASRLQRHAAARLPRAAVPSSIVFLNHFPRTTSGKVDYLALTSEGDPS